MALTGKHRWRSDWRGRPILEVQVRLFGMPAYSRTVGHWTEWRQATMDDLLEPELEHLLDRAAASVAPQGKPAPSPPIHAGIT